MRETPEPVIERSFRRLVRRHRDLPAALAGRLRDEPDRLVESARAIKDGDRCTVRRIDTAAGPLVIKRYNRRGPIHSVAHAIVRSRAAWSWRSAHRLLEAGLRTPRPRAMMEERWGPFRGRSFLLADFVEGAPLIEAAKADAARVAPLAAEFATLWEGLGRVRAVHGDMKATNFLVDAAGRIWIVDLDAMRFHPPGPLFRRERAKDRERFLRNWRGGGFAPEVEAAFRARIDTT
jgi:hypothetical protein